MSTKNKNYLLTKGIKYAILISVTGIVTDLHQKEMEHQNIILKRKMEFDMIILF